MKRRLSMLMGAMFLLASMFTNLYAQTFSADKVYTIKSNNVEKKYMKDMLDNTISTGEKGVYSYWRLIPTENTGCYYVKNAITGKYMQKTSEYEKPVKTGTDPVEIFIKNDPDKGTDVYGLASTDRTPHDFASDDTYGANLHGSKYYVQGFSAKLGASARPNSFWKIEEERLEVWDGSADAILPSIKHGGKYSAFTKLYNADYVYGDGEKNNDHFNVIVGTPVNDGSNNDWYAENYSMTDWTFGNSALPNFGDGKPADIYVRRYFIVNNNIPSTVYMPAPHDDAPCEYYINGTLVWSRTGTESGNGWYEDEIIVLTDTQKALIHTDGTPNVFAFHVHQNWGGRYADGGLYVGGTPANRCAEFALLEATVPLAENMGINVTDYRNAVNSHMYSQFRDKLYPLRTEMRMKVLDKHANVFNGNTPAAGDFYLYNVGTGAFFCGGSDWGAHAAIGFPGIKVTLEADGENFKINTHLTNGKDGDNNKEYLNHKGYCDTWTSDSWKFVSTNDEGKSYYYIKRVDDESKMLGWNATTKDGYNDGAGPFFDNVSSFQGSTTNNNNKWILVTEDDRNALMENANSNNGVDVSYLIQSPNFNQREDKAAWSKTGGDYHNGPREPYYIYDAYNLTYSDLHQTINDLRPGLYRVSTTAMYRKSEWSTGDDDIKARLYAYSGKANTDYRASSDDTAVTLPNVTTGFGKAPGFDTQAALGEHQNVCQAMEMGAFPQTSIDVYVGADGKLTFGVMKEDGGDSDCTYADNWRLTYLGPVTSVPVSISSYGIATFSNVYDLDFTNTDIVPYRAESANNERILFKKIESLQVPANTGVLLVSNGAVNADVPVVASATAITDQNLMHPSVTATTLSGSNNYVLAMTTGDTAPLFYQAAVGYVSGAGKAYLEVPASSSRLAISFDDTTTGIYQMEDGRWKMEDSVFDLQGRKFDGSRLKGQGSRLNPGLYIINGKKQVVK